MCQSDQLIFVMILFLLASVIPEVRPGSFKLGTCASLLWLLSTEGGHSGMWACLAWWIPTASPDAESLSWRV